MRLVLWTAIDLTIMVIGPLGIHSYEVDNGNVLQKPVIEDSGKAYRLTLR